MTTAATISRNIINGQFTNDELNKIAEAVRFARANIVKTNIATIRAGASVQFTSSKTGKNVTGEVAKVGRKFLLIREHGVSYNNWRVPANMVEVI
jgi:Tfp pilus assembly protein FimT